MVAHSRFTRSDYAVPAQKAAAAIRKGAAKPLKVTPRIRSAIEQMVFHGLKRPEAAAAADLTDHALRTALTKPHVLNFLNEQMEVLRTGARPSALRKMVDLLDADAERIQFEAAKYLDGMDRPTHSVGATQVNVQVNNSVTVQPGYVIDLSPDSSQQIDHLPQHDDTALDDNADVPDDE